MTIAAVLCWFDEQPAMLERCATSLHGFADTLVTLDGRWLLHDAADAPAASPAEQHEALRAAAASASVRLIELDHDGQPFPSQVAKRDRLYREAIDETGCDWIFLIDGDEHVGEFDGAALRAALASIREDVATVLCTRTHNLLKTRTRHPRRFFRASEVSGVEETHNGIRAWDGRWLSGPRRIAVERPADLSHLVHVEHEVQARGGRRNALQRGYYDARRRERVEIF